MTSAVSGSQGLWLTSRASGLVLLLLFSAVVVLGVAIRTGAASKSLPKSAVAGLHRTLSLFAVALLVLHVTTAMLDPYVSIGWLAAVAPFTSHYERLALGAGTLAVDFAGAVLITSLLRGRLGFRAWRAVHYLAYLAWPVAFVHAIRAASYDNHLWPVAAAQWASLAAVATAVMVRLATGSKPLPVGAYRDSLVPGRPASSAVSRSVRMRALREKGPALRAVAPGLGSDSRRLPRLLPDDLRSGAMGLRDHLARYGPVSEPAGQGRAALIADVARARLAGRGGAGFPTARKLAAVAGRPNPIVIGNGTEGEPASAKDKVLLARSPHLVLDGAAIAASLIGAREAVIVAHPSVSDIVAAAVAERERGRLGQVRLTVVTGPERFVGGEASAVVNWVGHGVPKPLASPPRPSERGLHGRPTLVQNVETLAHLALIARYGAGWFGGVGTASEPGSMLVTLAGAVRDPGVHEIAIGTPVARVLGLGGGATSPLSALLVGGYFGTWVDANRAAGLAFSAEGLRALGAGPGAGLLVALPAGACGLAETARIARYLATESAGQCGPCVFGLDAIASQLERLAKGSGADVPRLSRWIGQVGSGRGGCKHPDGAVRMITSALTVFGAEVDAHLTGRCRGAGHHRGVLAAPAMAEA